MGRVRCFQHAPPRTITFVLHFGWDGPTRMQRERWKCGFVPRLVAIRSAREGPCRRPDRSTMRCDRDVVAQPRTADPGWYDVHRCAGDRAIAGAGGIRIPCRSAWCPSVSAGRRPGRRSHRRSQCLPTIESPHSDRRCSPATSCMSHCRRSFRQGVVRCRMARASPEAALLQRPDLDEPRLWRGVGRERHHDADSLFVVEVRRPDPLRQGDDVSRRRTRSSCRRDGRR